MATNMLGKVVAGAALGGASLLAFAPGIAVADGAAGDAPHHEGKVYADPHAAQPGHEVKLIEICPEPQEHAFVWSEVTGKVKLQPGEQEQGEEEEEEEEETGGRWPGHHAEETEDAEDAEEEAEKGHWPRHGEEEAADEAEQPGGNAKHPGGWGGGDEAKDEAKKKAEEEARKKAAAEEGKKKAAEEAAEEAAAEEEAEAKPHFVYYGEATIAADAEPGTYKLKGSCGVGSVVVLPTGPVEGGDGGRGGADRGTAVGGAAMLGAAALGGIVLMRRRRTDESPV
ncbi:hypothetical protein O7606_25670 [Micromonospora sp. WMMD882]|uniref:hypothetical protein n=1 Tax=Micromonospora sp. WMMD882 TaxID=3015151 RepID=UPI00248B8DBA|nr:hypothetical protein [Micromonospora sp. WMMD882]WBB79501.1 hypothetical protein O7606_25670 [Micromonospora sp. WMMD882]